MIAWLAARAARSCLPFTDTRADRRWVRASPRALAERLPAAGPLLTLATPVPTAAATAGGFLVARTELAALPAMHWLIVGSRVDADGPHEWIECRDRDGRLGLQCHLLPDTDYLGWEALTCLVENTAACEAPPMCDPPPSFLGVLDFRWHRQAGLNLVDAVDVTGVSPWGSEAVRAAARATGLPIGSVGGGGSF
ncbi:MAG: hypothetical protein EPN56_10110 [Rhodanobacter sp.]|nr:MAG: hypothetical protein EPN78_02530 [Rhodanobacter sp.]TAM13218.1 MAG: hypothetical protein EPN66_05715 [Rhodanobacter sp.]TAM35362.1 MAG: hypothetical protein EPN56_10110 [Rhodanobacter sp.]